jgi:hypothetical protein
MKLKKLAKEAIYLTTGLLNRGALERYNFILLLAMPRSGSTLLTHILDTSSAIITIGETKTAYTSRRDLVRTIGKMKTLQKRHGLDSNRKALYILDKVVHNTLLTPENYDLLKDERFRIIFLTREPRGTAKSLVRALKELDGRQALEMYIARAHALREQAAHIGEARPAVVLDYEQVIRCTQPMMSLLERYLELPDKLSEEYQITPLTGLFNLGDKSAKIKAGRVLRQTKNAERVDVTLPQDLLAEAQTVYMANLEEMRRHCLFPSDQDCQAGETLAR